MYGAFSRKLTTKKSKDLHHPLNIEEMNIFTPNILILKILMSEDIWILVTLRSGNTSNSSHKVPVLLNRPVHTSLESNLSSWTMFWGRNANIGPTLITCDQNSKWQSYFKTKKKRSSASCEGEQGWGGTAAAEGPAMAPAVEDSTKAASSAQASLLHGLPPTPHQCCIVGRRDAA